MLNSQPEILDGVSIDNFFAVPKIMVICASKVIQAPFWLS
jgi:hypothetical protein